MTYSFKMRRRHALQLLAGASGAALLHACGGGTSTDSTADDSSADSTEPTMSLALGTVPWVGQVPLYIAIEKGFFVDEGLDFTLNLFGSNGEYLSSFLSGQLDAISPVSSEAVVLKAQGKDYKIVLVQDNSVGGDGSLAKDSSASIEDFKGKEIAVDTAGVSYFGGGYIR